MQVGGRLVGRAPQVIGAQLDQPPVGPQAGERQRRVLAREQDEVDEGRRVLDHEADQAMDRVGADDVVVVEHDLERVVAP